MGTDFLFSNAPLGSPRMAGQSGRWRRRHLFSFGLKGGYEVFRPHPFARKTPTPLRLSHDLTSWSLCSFFFPNQINRFQMKFAASQGIQHKSTECSQILSWNTRFRTPQPVKESRGFFGSGVARLKFAQRTHQFCLISHVPSSPSPLPAQGSSPRPWPPFPTPACVCTPCPYMHDTGTICVSFPPVLRNSWCWNRINLLQKNKASG